MMNNKKKEKGITLANLIAVVGLVLLLVFLYVGHSYKSGGEMGIDVLVAISITAFSAFLLWLMIKAKGAENRVRSWKKVEFVTLGIYILLAIPLSVFGGVMQFFVVNGNREEIKLSANDDLASIDTMLNEYNDSVRHWISSVVLGMQNSVREGQSSDSSLDSLWGTNSRNTDGINSYKDVNNNKFIIDAEHNKKFYTRHCNRRDSIRKIIEGWNIFQIPQLPKCLDNHANGLRNYLQKKLNEADFPIIVKDSSTGKYKSVGRQNRVSQLSDITEQFQFKQAVRKSGVSAWGVIIALLIHIMILFNYVVAYRTKKTNVGKYHIDDGGHHL